MIIAETIDKLQSISDSPFDRLSFPIQLVEAYSPPKATLAKLKIAAARKGRPGELLWNKKLEVRTALEGETGPCVGGMRTAWNGSKALPRLLVATDGQEVVAYDTKLDDWLTVEFSQLSSAYSFFLPLGGAERYQGVPDSVADVKASSRLARFYDAILAANTDWTDHARVHELNLFITRLLFCMFAQSTGIIEKGSFSRLLHEYTAIDGSDTPRVLHFLFWTFSVDRDERTGIPQFARDFPYVNGGMFREHTEIPAFSRQARRVLVEAAELDWSEINPDIFGSMIQAIVKPDMRNELGMHYTSVPNIMKVLGPLFLESLEGHLIDAQGDVRKLLALLARIRSIRVFDPACGSGNFLIIAYKELCRLEMEVFTLLREHDRQFRMPFSEIRFENFVGVDIEDFAVETAKLSLYIAQHQMNVVFEEKFNVAPPALPLRDGSSIRREDATSVDWESVCGPDAQYETYIVGNPPYLGMTNQNKDHKADVQRIFEHLVKGYKELDYVAIWLYKAASYCHRHATKCALVSTNSICQGELVALFWPLVLNQHVEIGFAHQSFKWKNNASHNAGVTCVILGLRPVSNDSKVIYGGSLKRVVRHISPYLVEGDDTIVYKRSRSISGLPYMVYGNKPTDKGNLIVAASEMNAIIDVAPSAAKYFRPYLGSKEFLQGYQRWCIWIEDSELGAAQEIPALARRIDGVRKERLKSKAPSTRDKAKVAHRFIQIQDYGKPAIVIPGHSSENREYLPVGLVEGNVIVSNALFAIYNPEMWQFALLSSRMNRVWLAAAGGRIKTDYRYSNTMVWNTLPLPTLSDEQKAALEERAWAIIEQRMVHVGKTLASLYDSEKPIHALMEAHRENDLVIESIYNGHLFANDTERLEHMFRMYRRAAVREAAPLLKDTRKRTKKGAVIASA